MLVATNIDHMEGLGEQIWASASVKVTVQAKENVEFNISSQSQRELKMTVKLQTEDE